MAKTPAHKLARQKTRAYTAESGRPVMFPDADSFKEIFEGIDTAKKIVAVMKSGRDKMGFSNWVSISGKKNRWSFYATPKKTVIEALEKSMILVNYDEIYFEIIDRGGRDALVIAKYNQIIGSRYIAVIDMKTVPVSKT